MHYVSCWRLRLVVPLLVGWLLGTGQATAQQLFINEIMAANTATLADGTGAYEDWFEVYNPNSEAVDLAGYYLTDNPALPTKYRLPTGSAQTIVPANGHLLLWASEAPARGVLHVGFKLAAAGESVSLYRPDGTTPVDQVVFGPQQADISWGRQPDGASTWRFFPRTASSNETSPGTSNDTKIGFAEVLSAPVFSQSGGFYATAFPLSLTTSVAGATIFYTLDGSDPNPTDTTRQTFIYKNSYVQQPGQPADTLLRQPYQTSIYTDPIPVADRTPDPNRLSMKSSSYTFAPNYFPTTPQFKGTVVRAMVAKPDAMPSPVVSQTYFVTPDATRYGIPIMAITTDERSLFDYYSGFYTAGARFDTWRANNPTEAAFICAEGNYSYKEPTWQRPATLEMMLNGTRLLTQPIKLAINGGCSRSFPRKSLRLIGESNFQYPFFNSRSPTLFYDRLLLRSGGNDWDYSLISDVVMQRLVRHLPFTTQASRPAVVFLNGEYWGVHSLMERYDAHYLKRIFNVPTDSVDVIKADQTVFVADDGTMDQFNLLRSQFTTADPLNYSLVQTMMDLTSFTDYYIAQIYSANTDWPQTNQQFWRKRTSQTLKTSVYGHDGRFRWMMNDLDFGLSVVNQAVDNSLERVLGTNEWPDFTLFLRKLMDVPEYRATFINRYADLLNTTFLPDRASGLLAGIRQEYEPYMTEHFHRWETGNSLANWQNNVNNINQFVQQRPALVRDHIRAQFGFPANQTLTVNVPDTVQGYVRVNSLDIRPFTPGVAANAYPWSGIYFQGSPIRVVAKPKTGYRFVGWQEQGTTLTTDTAYAYDPTTARTLVALFEADQTSTAKPIPFPLSQSDYRFETWPATAPAGTYPPNMQFVSLNQPDPTLAATFTPADTITGGYAFSSSTRINGLGTNGIALINTGGGNNAGYVATALGGIVLALRTTGVNGATVQWTGGTQTPNPRQYGIRLRYRLGDSGSFQDLPDGAGNPVTYQRNATAGHSAVMGPVALPALLLNKPYVQLLWQYFYTGIGTSGARDQLRLDDILIARDNCQSITSGPWTTPATWSCGRVPGLTDSVIINSGHVVTLNIPTAEAKSLKLNTTAQLRYTTNTAALRLRN